MKIFRAKDTTVYQYDLLQWIYGPIGHSTPRITEGDKFGISWKVGKRRKLRSYHLDSIGLWECDCCGPQTSLTIRKGNKTHRMESHTGLGYMQMSHL